MASFLSLYSEIEYKVKHAIIRLDEYRAKISLLTKENEQLKRENAALQEQVAEFNEKYKLLTLTQTLLKKEDKTDIKKKINDLVREIDNCILLLNK